jgi:hypothetical protein
MAVVHRHPDGVAIETDLLAAFVRHTGYVSGIAAGTFLDKRTGAREAGFGLAIADWLLEPGADDERWGERYAFDNPMHGRLAKRLVEWPQICTRAGRIEQEVDEGEGVVVVRQRYRYPYAAPGRRPGSRWEQTLVFRDGLRYALVADRVTSVNAGTATALRVDMPGHIRHRADDTFHQVYLSYGGTIPASAFAEDFPPDARYRYVRTADGPVPARMIRAYQVKVGGEPGPWLAGMTLDAGAVAEAWCHQRGYVCLIEEVGGWPIAAGESFGAAYVVGYFDDLAAMEAVYDGYRGARRIAWDGTRALLERD